MVRSIFCICSALSNCSSAGSPPNARLIINAYPVLVLATWRGAKVALVPCHQTRPVAHGALGPAELWKQVAHVDPVVANPSVSQYTRREAQRHRHKRADGRRFFD